MIKAYPAYTPDLQFRWAIRSDDKSETYFLKDKLKQYGAKWSKDCLAILDCWYMSDEDLMRMKNDGYPIFKMKYVFVAPHCHEPAGHALANEAEVERGEVKTGCSLCDSSNVWAKIITRK